MGTYYVDSSATGANNGTSMADAWTSAGSFLTNAINGDVGIVRRTHSESLGGAVTVGTYGGVASRIFLRRWETADGGAWAGDADQLPVVNGNASQINWNGMGGWQVRKIKFIMPATTNGLTGCAGGLFEDCEIVPDDAADVGIPLQSFTNCRFVGCIIGTNAAHVMQYAGNNEFWDCDFWAYSSGKVLLDGRSAYGPNRFYNCRFGTAADATKNDFQYLNQWAEMQACFFENPIFSSGYDIHAACRYGYNSPRCARQVFSCVGMDPDVHLVSTSLGKVEKDAAVSVANQYVYTNRTLKVTASARADDIPDFQKFLVTELVIPARGVALESIKLLARPYGFAAPMDISGADANLWFEVEWVSSGPAMNVGYSYDDSTGTIANATWSYVTFDNNGAPFTPLAGTNVIVRVFTSKYEASCHFNLCPLPVITEA